MSHVKTGQWEYFHWDDKTAKKATILSADLKENRICNIPTGIICNGYQCYKTEINLQYG